MSIPIYVAKTYYARSTGKMLREVQCEQCNARFFYWLSRSALGSGDAPYNLGGDRAAKKAKKTADETLQKSLARDHDVVPCPHCQHVQRAMIDHARKSMQWGLWVAALMLLIMGPLYTLAGLVLLSSGSLNSRGEENASSFWWVPGAVGAGAGLLVLLVRGWLLRGCKSTGPWLEPFIGASPPAMIVAGRPYERFEYRLKAIPRTIAAREQSQDDSWVQVPWLRVTFPAVCIECLEPATTVFRCPFRGKEKSETPMPLCADCATRIERLWRRNRARVVGGSIIASAALALALMPVEMQPWARLFIPIFVSFVLSMLLCDFLPAMMTRPFQMKSVDEERSIYRLRFRNPRYTEFLRKVVAECEPAADESSAESAKVRT